MTKHSFLSKNHPSYKCLKVLYDAVYVCFMNACSVTLCDCFFVLFFAYIHMDFAIVN